MSFDIQLTLRAHKSFKKLEKRISIRIALLIDSLKDNPRPNGVKKMKGHDHRYRVREGDYRVIYQIDDGQLLILVVDLGHRKDIYR